MKLGLAIVVGLGALALSGSGDAATPKPGKPRPSVEAPPEVIARVAAALATDDPAKMRAEAKKLRREGWDQEASDLEMAANELERLKTGIPAPTTPQPQTPVSTAPKPASTGPRNLVQGMRGADVTAWQQQLIRDGYDHLKADGIFGPLTSESTKLWQTERGLKSDGIVGPATRAAIGSPPIASVQKPKGASGATVAVAVPKPAPAPAPAPVKPPAPAPAPAKPKPALPTPGKQEPPLLVTTGGAPARRNLKRGMKGDDVREWQSLLVMDGYVVQVDGIFGEKTEAATMQWQRDHGLTGDGIVGPKTLGMVGKPKVAPPSPAQPPLTINTDTWRTLKQGMTGNDVREWQLVLNKYGQTVATDGNFGPKTAEATKAFQTSYGLVPDGVVGKGTRAKLAQLAGTQNVVAGDLEVVVPSELHAPPPFLLGPEESEPPDETPEQLAARLVDHLNDVSPGAEDRELVQRFQRSQGLNDTGVYGPATAEAIALLGLVPPQPREWPTKKMYRAKTKYKLMMREHARLDPARASAWIHAANV